MRWAGSTTAQEGHKGGSRDKEEEGVLRQENNDALLPHDGTALLPHPRRTTPTALSRATD